MNQDYSIEWMRRHGNSEVTHRVTAPTRADALQMYALIGGAAVGGAALEAQVERSIPNGGARWAGFLKAELSAEVAAAAGREFSALNLVERRELHSLWATWTEAKLGEYLWVRR